MVYSAATALCGPGIMKRAFVSIMLCPTCLRSVHRTTGKQCSINPGVITLGADDAQTCSSLVEN